MRFVSFDIIGTDPLFSGVCAGGRTEVIVRWTQIALIGAVALYYTLVVINNVTDYGSNYRFVQHVLSMDTTFPRNRGSWRAIHEPLLQRAVYDGIIIWEAVTATLAWIGAAQLMLQIRATVDHFNAAKRLSIVMLATNMLFWFVAFITVGGEWFLMWQSNMWNGEEAAFRMFVILGVVLILLVVPQS
jgi:predicted small integral membrane protein